MMVLFKFKNCHLAFYPEREYCETVFADGFKVEASPMDSPEYRASAIAHGYGDNLMLFCLQHELLHTALAEAGGLNYSPVLWDVAHGVIDKLKHNAEEGRVMDIQRLLMKSMSCLP